MGNNVAPAVERLRKRWKRSEGLNVLVVRRPHSRKKPTPELMGRMLEDAFFPNGPGKAPADSAYGSWVNGSFRKSQIAQRMVKWAKANPEEANPKIDQALEKYFPGGRPTDEACVLLAKAKFNGIELFLPDKLYANMLEWVSAHPDDFDRIDHRIRRATQYFRTQALNDYETKIDAETNRYFSDEGDPSLEAYVAYASAKDFPFGPRDKMAKYLGAHPENRHFIDALLDTAMEQEVQDILLSVSETVAREGALSRKGYNNAMTSLLDAPYLCYRRRPEAMALKMINGAIRKGRKLQGSGAFGL